MTRFAISMNDDSVAIMQMVGDSTPEAEIARWPEKERAKVISITPIDEADIPADRAFRNAWRISGDRIDHDMERARGIHMDRVRRSRNARLLAMDTETTVALGKSDAAAVADAEARKQRLRDIPQMLQPQIDAAETVDDLKAIWPERL